MATVEQDNVRAAASRAPGSGSTTTWLKRAMLFCAWSMGIGQALFVLFIALFYYPSTLSGNFARWNSKPLITGFQAGDGTGNAGFAIHVLFAAIITAAGLMQITPRLRQRFPRLHRWTGRSYMVAAIALSLGGLWLVWVRGTYLNLAGAVGITANALVILTCAGMSWRYALRRKFAQHRRWALRLFVAASAVWFMRVGYMAWGITTGGIGIGERMDGPFDQFLAFGNMIVPLLVLEAYLRAGECGDRRRLAVAALLAVSGIVMLGGSAAAWFVMWSPYI
ncbi:MAG: DUF2306 domain-containing protein [Sphingomonadales bacterium]|nr:DUF2306 domain-containing protein [Sphingomonadales bacterium]MBD3772997.1 DUF2306 domain-containing protein [Paracoccaceae bacterium]